MPYTAPTPADIRARFPEFTVERVSDVRMSAVIEEAKRYVDTSWLEGDYAPALRFLTAHMLASEGVLRDPGLTPLTEVSGSITSERLGDAAVTYGNWGGSQQTSIGDAQLMQTPYGRSYLTLRRVNFAGPVIVS